MGRFRRLFLIVGFMLITACSATTPTVPKTEVAAMVQAPVRPEPRVAVENFVNVLQRVGPVVTDVCKARRPVLNCDFIIVVDDRPGLPPNAFQTVDPAGRPVIAFTLPLVAKARNADELAFVLGHEAAHHISHHLPRQNAAAQMGATIMANLAGVSRDADAIDRAAQIGAAIGARTFSKEFELEADALGAIITERAGYDALVGAEFFFRIPDPGDQFLGTHPPNADRVRIVNETVARLRRGDV